MRKLILTRGHPGSGKTHAIEAAGLADWTLSADSLRVILASPMLVDDGRLILNQDVNERVFPMMNKLAGERMALGETLVLDTTGVDRATLRKWLALAHYHRYETAVLDMSDIPLETAIQRNSLRPETRKVPEQRIREMREQIRSNPLDNDGSFTLIKGREDGNHVRELEAWLQVPSVDLSSFRSVVHIGDLQGCYTVLACAGGPLADGFRDDTFYIFVGDLLDRGIENGKVMKWFMEEALHRENVALLWGNHEDHIHRWSRGMEAVSNEFEKRTLPQLEAEGITPEDADAVCSKAVEILRYDYRGTRVMVTHAGLATWPEKPHLVSMRTFTNGRYWSDPVDEAFERNTSGVFQVHGHRNYHSLPVRASTRSFNLEDSVEFGGHLRTCTLGPDGWSTASYRNQVFRPMRERIAAETVMSNARRQERKSVPHWMFDGTGGSTLIGEDLLAVMRAHPGVREKTSERFPQVASLNFTKKVFYDQSWDDVVVKARGFFFNKETREIVARGYEKFFNIGEREETSLECLMQNMVFPVRLYEKENGFLGNIGYDRQTDSIFVASKSTPDGEFADMFRRILDETLDGSKQERLRRYLRDTESSMTFEVIDPVNDPHMVDYPEAKMVLLDIIRRSHDFEKAHFEVVKETGKKFGVETKKLGMFFKDPSQFSAWYRSAMGDFRNRIEGYVVEDASGFMTKVKLPYYAFWKRMRGMKDRLVSAREKDKVFAFDPAAGYGGRNPLAEEIAIAESFRDWCLEQDNETLKSDIITLRKLSGIDFGRTMGTAKNPRM